MPIVNCDTVDIEDTSDFLDDVSPASFDSVPLFHCVGVVCLCTLEIKDVWETFKGRVVDALDKKVGLGALFCDKHHLLDIFMVPNQHALQCGLSEGKHE